MKWEAYVLEALSDLLVIPCTISNFFSLPALSRYNEKFIIIYAMSWPYNNWPEIYSTRSFLFDRAFRLSNRELIKRV
jgi:hypothetical protein